MVHKSFSISDAVTYGFNTTKKNLVFFAVLLIIILSVSFVPSYAAGLFEQDLPIIGFIFTLIGWGLQLAISLGAIGVALRVHDKKKVDYKNLLDYLHLIIPYFFASILYGLIVIGGFILLVVPGIVWSIKFRYYSYFMVDKNMGPIEALKASAKITEGVKWNLFLLTIVLAIINIIGMLLLFVGLLFTAPLAMMAEAYVFRKLSSK